MKKIHLSQYDDSTWELPSFDEVQYGEKDHEYALVIPVINEGNRIQRQLQRILHAELPVDVIVADGGSNDGSLDPDYMREVNVTTVLLRPGQENSGAVECVRLCLRKGYGGIVTIDGNGKDGVEAVADMVAKLEEACDYAGVALPARWFGGQHAIGTHNCEPLDSCTAVELGRSALVCRHHKRVPRLFRTLSSDPGPAIPRCIPAL